MSATNQTHTPPTSEKRQEGRSEYSRQAESDVSPIARSIEDLLTSLTTNSPDQRLPPISDSPSATYTFSPVWPMEGSLQKAFGVLGKTRYETIKIVRRGFPSLSDIDSSRFILEIKIYDSPNFTWVRVMDEAWEGLATREGVKIRVRLEDTPEIKEQRKISDKKFNQVFLGIVVGVPVVFGFVCAVVFRK